MDAGTRIVRSCELVEHMWMQIAALGNSLGSLTETALGRGDFKDLRSAGAWIQRYQQGPSGWTSTNFGISVPVMEKWRRKIAPSAWINYQISVFGLGIPLSVDGDQESIGPVVHVSCWHLPTDFKDSGVYVEFPPVWDDWKIKDKRLLFWENKKEGKLHEWTFSIRLLDLDSEDAIRTSILQPVGALLAGAETTAALPTALPGLIFYADEELSEGGFTLLASRYRSR